MTAENLDPGAAVAALLSSLNARAAGLWRIEGDRLEQVVFAPGRALPDDVARGFAEATRSVALAQTSLGIVRAALSGAPVVARAAESPDHDGSGRWLRAFDAARSVAVPLVDDQGTVQGVVAVALPDADRPDDQAVADILRQAVRWWLDATRSRSHNG